MRHLRDVLRSGHPPTLLSAFLYFDVSFMVWVLPGALAVFIAEELRLGPAAKGLLVAVPLLGGALFRPILGWLADRFGGRRVGLAGMAATSLPLLLGWQCADSLPLLLVVGLLLGVAGGSFAVAMPLASRWYPPEHQGLVLGIAGAGNSGTLLATLLAPRLAEAFGWRAVFGLALLPLAAVALMFACCARDNPAALRPAQAANLLRILRQPDAFAFCLLYALTFGGFVGLASFLPLFFRDRYGISAVSAGDLTTLCVFGGSVLRPIGGYLADRFGGLRLLQGLFVAVGALALLVAQAPGPELATALFLPMMAGLGLGNGAIFQLVPQRFPNEVGGITGLVGAAGGLGGFLLPSALGALRGASGSFAPGFFLLALAAAAAAQLVIRKRRAWPSLRRHPEEARGARASLAPAE